MLYPKACYMCGKKIKPGAEYLIRKREGYRHEIFRLCRECARDYNAWMDTIDEYRDELAEYYAYYE